MWTEMEQCSLTCGDGLWRRWVACASAGIWLQLVNYAQSLLVARAVIVGCTCLSNHIGSQRLSIKVQLVGLVSLAVASHSSNPRDWRSHCWSYCRTVVLLNPKPSRISFRFVTYHVPATLDLWIVFKPHVLNYVPPLVYCQPLETDAIISLMSATIACYNCVLQLYATTITGHNSLLQRPCHNALVTNFLIAFNTFLHHILLSHHFTSFHLPGQQM